MKYRKTEYGFFPQMKAEGIAFKEEKAGSVIIGTNPGFQNGVLIVEECDDKDICVTGVWSLHGDAHSVLAENERLQGCNRSCNQGG